MFEFFEYPKWVAVDGEGDPRQPGYVLCDDAEAEAALKPAPKTKTAKE
jgi:hypothetical protein